MSEQSGQEPRERTEGDIAHNARVWNYWLGGKDHYEVDQQVGNQVTAMYPSIGEVARADRAFLGRAVTHLAGRAGIRQYLDIGTGLPTAENTHEVAQRIAPDSRVVYVDNDPIVLTHARALLTSTDEGATSYVDADARDPAAILRAASGTLDLGLLVAVMMLGILNFVLDTAEATSIVRHLLGRGPLRQLPRAHASHAGTGRRGKRGGDALLERERDAADHRTRPGRDRGLPRRARRPGAGPRLLRALADGRRRRGAGRGAVRCHGPQALTNAATHAVTHATAQSATRRVSR